MSREGQTRIERMGDSNAYIYMYTQVKMRVGREYEGGAGGGVKEEE